MVEFTPLETILINPWKLLLATAVLWLIIHVLFRYFKPNSKCLKIWEIIYLCVGFLGITSIALDFRKTINSFGLEYRESSIKSQINDLNFYDNNFCWKYIKSEYSPVDFDDRQSDQDLLCEWVKNKYIPLDTIEYIKETDLDTININDFDFKTDFTYSLINEYNNRVSFVNRNIAKYRQQEKESSSDLPFIIKVLSIPFLLLTLALRLSITSYNIHLLKKKDPSR